MLERLGRGAVFELGFSSLGAYAVERCERSVRWAEAARCLARRVEPLVELRHALATGTISWSMAEVLARIATPSDEARWLAFAQSRTVRQVQQHVDEVQAAARPPAETRTVAHSPILDPSAITAGGDSFARDAVERPTARDAGGRDAPASDASSRDAPVRDAGGRDATASDAGGRDAPAHDARGRDAPAHDAGGRDATASDASSRDAPVRDAGGRDATGRDAGGRDAPVRDAGIGAAPASDAGIGAARAHDAGSRDATARDADVGDAPRRDADVGDAADDELGRWTSGTGPLCTLTYTVDREDAWLYEATRCLLEQLGERDGAAQSEALLAEAQDTLLMRLPRGAIDVADLQEGQERHAAQQRWVEQLRRWRVEAETACENNFRGELVAARAAAPAAAPSRWALAASLGLAPLEHSPCTALDRQVRSVTAALARRELELSQLVLRFHRADGWRRLGYATEGQYALERLGLSRSGLAARRALALRLERLPRVAAALGAGRIGVEAALQLVRIATPSTEAAWVERGLTANPRAPARGSRCRGGRRAPGRRARLPAARR